MTRDEILKELEEYGDLQTKKTYLRHGAKEPFYGVKVGDLKKILKKTKKNHRLSLELYDTGNSDAMYLAGLMADEKKITREQLENWVEGAYWYFLSEYAVPWVAAETEFGFNLGKKWIDSSRENIAAAGWSTLSYYAAVNSDEVLDIDAYNKMLDRVENGIDSAQNRVRLSMNGFVIATGTYIAELTQKALEVAKNIGTITVHVGDTACKVPEAANYLQKAMDKGRVGKKRKTARC